LLVHAFSDFLSFQIERERETASFFLKISTASFLRVVHAVQVLAPVGIAIFGGDDRDIVLFDRRAGGMVIMIPFGHFNHLFLHRMIRAIRWRIF